MGPPPPTAPPAPDTRPWWDPSPRRTNLIATVLLFLITVPLLTKIFTSDFGTHIALGREIVRTWSITDKEFLNYPALGFSHANVEWGFEAILYLVFAAGGVYGVSLFCWAVVFGIFWFIYRSIVIRGGHPILAVLAIFAFSGFLRIRVQPRPEILTYLFTALSIYLFSEYFYGKRKRVIYLFPVAVLFWANVHPTYLMGFILCATFTADALARAAWNREFAWEKLKTWIYPPIVVGLLALMLCGLNPHGWDALLTPLHVISRSGAGGGGGANPILMSISELTPVKGTGFYSYYKSALIFSAASILLGFIGRRLYLLDLLLFAIAFKGAWDSARAVSMMGLFLSGGTALHLTGFFSRVDGWLKPAAPPPKAKDASREKGKRKGGTAVSPGAGEKSRAGTPASPAWIRGAVIGVTAAVLVIYGGTTLSFSFSQLEFGMGMTEHKFSFGAAEFLRKNPVQGRMWNFFDIGGFLDWQLYPGALTFIDGRTYNQQLFMDHQSVSGASQGWQDVLNRYGVTYIVTKAMDSSGMILPLIPALSADPDWVLVYSDGLFVIFVKNIPENQGIIRAHAMSKGILPRHIILESYHYMFLGVSPIMAYQTMSNMYYIMGDLGGAIESLKRALEYGDVPYLRNRLADLMARAGRGPTPSGTR